MKKTKALELNSKWLLIAGSIVILVALLLWGVLGGMFQSTLHDAPLTPLTPFSKIEGMRDGPRYVPPNEPVEKLRNPIREIEIINPAVLEKTKIDKYTLPTTKTRLR